MFSWVQKLSHWYDNQKRDFPWRADPDPYRVWICEVMSQQTLLSVVLPKYEQFLREIPDVTALAECSEDQLRRLWSGLGYYARARSLQKGARYIKQHFENLFPTSYEEWLKVPGCGPYTAAIISSICFDQKVAAVDGNVIRVVARLNTWSDVWSREGQENIRRFAQSVIPERRPGDFNQSMMELGAVVCRKQKPACYLCPINDACLAYKNGVVLEIPPVKPRAETIQKRIYVWVVKNKEGKLLTIQRTNGFLKGTRGLPITETLLAGGNGVTCGTPIKHRITKYALDVAVQFCHEPSKKLLEDLYCQANADDVLWETLPNLSSSLDSKCLRAAERQSLLWS